MERWEDTLDGSVAADPRVADLACAEAASNARREPTNRRNEKLMRHAPSAENVVLLFEPAAFLPSQLAGCGDRRDCPEMRLIAAMLEDALRSIFRCAGAQRGRRRQEFAEAWEWVLDDGRAWPFAFANVCDLLGLDATAVRLYVCGLSGQLRARRGTARLDDSRAFLRNGRGRVRPRPLRRRQW